MPAHSRGQGMNRARIDRAEPRTAQLRIGSWSIRTGWWPAAKGAGRSIDPVPILFFNGIGLSLEACGALAEVLPGRALLTFDAPGVGGSALPAVPYAPAQIAWIASQVLEARGIRQADVFGFSWGGAMAQQFALQHPDRVRRLILAATSPGYPMVPGDPAVLAKALDPEAFFVEVLSEADRPTRALLASLEPPRAWGYACQLLALAGWSSAAQLPFLRKPTLLLEGARDRLVPGANTRLLQVLIAGSRRTTIEGAGHLFPYSHPERTIAALIEFDATFPADRRAA